MKMRSFHWGFKPSVRRLLGGGLLFAGILLALVYLPVWIWLVSLGLLAAIIGLTLLRDY